MRESNLSTCMFETLHVLAQFRKVDIHVSSPTISSACCARSPAAPSGRNSARNFDEKHSSRSHGCACINSRAIAMGRGDPVPLIHHHHQAVGPSRKLQLEVKPNHGAHAQHFFSHFMDQSMFSILISFCKVPEYWRKGAISERSPKHYLFENYKINTKFNFEIYLLL